VLNSFFGRGAKLASGQLQPSTYEDHCFVKQLDDRRKAEAIASEKDSAEAKKRNELHQARLKADPAYKAYSELNEERGWISAGIGVATAAASYKTGIPFWSTYGGLMVGYSGLALSSDLGISKKKSLPVIGTAAGVAAVSALTGGVGFFPSMLVAGAAGAAYLAADYTNAISPTALKCTTAAVALTAGAVALTTGWGFVPALGMTLAGGTLAASAATVGLAAYEGTTNGIKAIVRPLKAFAELASLKVSNAIRFVQARPIVQRMFDEKLKNAPKGSFKNGPEALNKFFNKQAGISNETLHIFSQQFAQAQTYAAANPGARVGVHVSNSPGEMVVAEIPPTAAPTATGTPQQSSVPITIVGVSVSNARPHILQSTDGGQYWQKPPAEQGLASAAFTRIIDQTPYDLLFRARVGQLAEQPAPHVPTPRHERPARVNAGRSSGLNR